MKVLVNFLVIVIFLRIRVVLMVNSDDLVDYYVNLIESGVQDSNNYMLPDDYSAFQPNFTNTDDDIIIIDLEQFHFIVVGIGSTGSVLINRLSAISCWRTLALEAGEFSNDFTDIVGITSFNWFSKYNWGHYSTPQTTCCLGSINQRCMYARGKGVGGSSIINGALYVRGNRHDFDSWEVNGNPGWSYDNVLPMFKHTEQFQANLPGAPLDSMFHGYSSELSTEFCVNQKRHNKAFYNAYEEMGYQIIDYNGYEQIGVSPMQITARNGRRCDTGTAFVKNILKRRPNLTLLTGSFVTKILIEPITKTAYGVEFRREGNTYRAKAKFEVILSAGTFSSAQLLMLSGIGPNVDLEKVGIPVVENLPVGQTLQDHVTVRGLFFNTNSSLTAVDLKTLVQQYLRGYGDLSPQYSSVAHQNLNRSIPVPNVQMLFIPPTNAPNQARALNLKPDLLNQFVSNSDPLTTFNIMPFLMHPKSSGTLRLNSSNPYEFPLINLRYLSDVTNEDIENLYQATQFVLRLVETSKAFQSMNATLLYINVTACQNYPYLSKPYWYCRIRQLSAPEYHVSGTCAMGPDPSKFVVNHQLKVHGIHNLRVADASIFPDTISGNPNAVCVMIGEKLAADLLAQYLFFKG